jgi:hypothetical protein
MNESSEEVIADLEANAAYVLESSGSETIASRLVDRI